MLPRNSSSPITPLALTTAASIGVFGMFLPIVARLMGKQEEQLYNGVLRTIHEKLAAINNPNLPMAKIITPFGDVFNQTKRRLYVVEEDNKTAVRNNMRLLAIVLGEKDAKTRNNEMMELLDYGFNTVKLNKLKSKGDVLI